MASEHVIREFPRFSYEEHVAEACTLMVSSRTILKVKMKKGRYSQFGQELRDFYSSFMQYYGLVFQRITNRGDELKKNIIIWDKKMTVLPIHNSSVKARVLINEGIKLSEDLQEVLKADGVFV